MKIPTGSPLAVFVRSLLPTFSRNSVTQQIEVLRGELKNNVIPVYRDALSEGSVFRGKYPFKSKWGKALNDKLMNVPQSVFRSKFLNKPQNGIELVYDIMSHLPQHLDHLERLVTKSFNDDISAKAMTHKQANLIRLVELTEFFLVCGRRLLLNLVYEEFAQYEGVRQSEPFVKGDVKWMEDNLNGFVTILSIYGREKEDLLRAIEAVPDILITENPHDQEMAKQQYMGQLDGLSMGFIPYVLNPIFHVKNALLHWRHHRLESAKLEKEQIELRLQQYMMRRNGEHNAKLEEIIENVSERLKKQNKKIAEMEASWEANYGK